ncbi:GPP34 family phosphoprotein [Streptosporangiaceae bacterium NEAU-GS5]|nr:GPP34 family phosphoprotein [Streptosporangiaceae bacterium NEAU-GS5]
MTVTIAEEVLLLAYRPDSGRRAIRSVELNAAVAGGLLAELAVNGRIALDGKHLVVSDRSPLGDEELDAALARMVADPKPRKPESWVRRLKNTRPRRRLLARLIASGVLTEKRAKALGIIPIRVYPTTASDVSKEIRDRVVNALDDAEPDPRTAALLGLIQAARLYRKVFPGIDRARLAALTKHDWVSVAVRRSINTTYAAAVAVG